MERTRLEVPSVRLDGGPPVPPTPAWAALPGLRRQRLLTLLDTPARLVLVLAPAGHGKTTLLAQHAARLRHPVGWHRVTPEDADEAQLIVGIHRALVGPPAPDRPPEGVDGLLDELRTRTPDTATLVLDDVHLLIGSPAEGALDRLLGEGPRQLRMVLASRRMPTLNLCRAEVGPVAVVGSDDLRFRSWEVEDLFRDFYGEPLPPDDVAALTRRTGGWAACLQLFHLSTHHRPPAERRRAVAALAGGARFARTYLASTVLADLRPDHREFLARTSVFELLTPERCDLLLGGGGADRALQDLARAEALTPADGDGRAFRCHDVLRRHFESALRERDGRAEVVRWHVRAAEILQAEGAHGEAVRALLRAEQWQRASRLLQLAGRRAINAGSAAVWEDLLPAQLVDEDPWLSTAMARRLAADERLAAAAGKYRRAELLHPDPGDRERTARERRLVELWTGAQPQPHLHWMDRLRAAVTRRPDTYVGAGGSEPGDRLADAVAALLAGDLATAGREVQRAFPEPSADPNDGEDSLLGLAARLVHAVIALAAGATVDSEVDRIAADADLLGAGWLARQARAVRALLMTDSDELQRVRDECRLVDDAWGELLAEAGAALARSAAGAPDSAAWLGVADRCAALDAGTLRAWALAAAALAARDAQDPIAPALAARADTVSRATGVWGTRHLLARAEPRRAPAPAPRSAARAAPPLQLRCLGAFEVLVDGRPVDWSGIRPRAASAFRLLAVHVPAAVHREALLLLWPRLPDGQATHSLQVAVSSVRSLLAPDAPRGSGRVLERRGESYLLVLPEGSRSDVAEFRQFLRAADAARASGRGPDEITALTAALAVYQGDLLPEDGPAEWVLPERDRLRLRAATAAAVLAGLHVAAGDLPSGAAAARRGIEIDPCSDASWRELVRACDRLGNTAAAARARRGYAEMLRDLGLPPGTNLMAGYS